MNETTHHTIGSPGGTKNEAGTQKTNDFATTTTGELSDEDDDEFDARRYRFVDTVGGGVLRQQCKRN